MSSSHQQTQTSPIHYTSALMTEDEQPVALPMSPALATILVDNHRQFLAFLERRVGDRAIAEDILQDAFVKSIQRGGDVREDSSATAWFYRLLRNAVIDHYRRSGTKSRAIELLSRELEGASVPPADMQDAICGCVTRLARTMKPEYAEALQRIEVEGVAVGDFAAEKGITSGNAAVRVFRARESLRRQVMASCGTCAEHGCLECSCT